MRYLAYLALIASVVLGIGCNLPEGPSGTGSSSGLGNTGGSNSTQGTMSATIGNIPWTANGRVTATYARSQNGVGSSVLNLAGLDFPLSNTLQFAVGSVTLGTDLTPGTFQVGTSGTNANLTDSFGNTFQAAGPVGSGTVTISTFSVAARTATGTFTFVLVQSGGIVTKVVNSGTFSVTF
jgi:hypothetical protein